MHRALIGILFIAMSCTPAGGGKRSGAKAGDAIMTDGANPNPDQPKDTCKPGERRCAGNALQQCIVASKTWADPVPCPEGTVCANNACLPCATGENLCQGKNVILCGPNASFEIVKTCPKECGNGVCLDCIPGAKECRTTTDGQSQTWECELVGLDKADWKLLATCPESTDCIGGLCINPCQQDIKLNTNQGCDYYAIDLENHDQMTDITTITGADAQFAVIVSNPSSTKNLSISVHQTHDSPALQTELLAPNTLRILPLGPRNISGSSQGQLAWRIKGDRPFVAYQFNPLDNVNPVYSNDASLLLPVNALDRNYMVMTWDGGGSFMTVVATKANTEVKVTVTAPTIAGPNIPALSPGESYTVTLNAGEVLNLVTAYGVQESLTLTGSTVSANRNIMVFGGNVCANTGRCCCDHLEQQMFPLSAWGTTYLAAKSAIRNDERDYWRILAREDTTTVTFTGNVSEPVVLNRGKYIDISSKESFVIQGDKPVMVGQFLPSSYDVIPKEKHCKTQSECGQGACWGASEQTGVCMPPCTSASGEGCMTGMHCLTGKVYPTIPNDVGLCVQKTCDPFAADICPPGTKCTNFDEKGYCVTSCITANDCLDPLHICNTGFCVAKECTTDGDCLGQLCNDGRCYRKCVPTGICQNQTDVCVPPGVGDSQDFTNGTCLPGGWFGCNSDDQCDAGHSCSVSQDNPQGSCSPIGDPAFILSVPLEQYRNDYVFLVPNAYVRDYVNVLAPQDAQVSLDGQPINSTNFVPIAGSKYKVARLNVLDGVHRITSNFDVGIVVYGYDDDVSYGYPGGANLFDLGK